MQIYTHIHTQSRAANSEINVKTTPSVCVNNHENQGACAFQARCCVVKLCGVVTVVTVTVSIGDGDGDGDGDV